MRSVRSVRAALCLALLLVTAWCPASARGEVRIGVLKFSEELRYQESLAGIKDALARAGYKEPAVRFVMGNAMGSKAKAAELVQQFASGRFDLMITLGTNATIAAAKELHTVPIVFCMVYDPVEARVAKDWKSSGTNVTGTSPRIPMSAMVGMLREFRPVKRLAVLYTPGEKNSEIQLREIQATQATQQIRVMPVIVATKEDLQQKLPEVLPAVDAVYLSGSSVIGSAVEEIVAIANRAKVVTVSHLADMVEKGVVLGMGANPYRLGTLAGAKAVRVLKGAKPSSVPIEALDRFDVLLNMKSVAAGHFTVPPAFMRKVTRIIK